MKDKFNNLKQSIEFSATTPDFLKRLKEPVIEEISAEKEIEYQRLLIKEEEPVFVDAMIKSNKASGGISRVSNESIGKITKKSKSIPKQELKKLRNTSLLSFK